MALERAEDASPQAAVPKSLQGWPELGLVDFDARLKQAARSHPHRLALKDSRRETSWGQLDKTINRIAHVLSEHGIAPGDRVAMLGRNSVDYAEAMFGILRAGACATPLPTLAGTQAMARMVADSGAKLLLAAQDYVAEAEAVLAAAGPDCACMLVEFGFSSGTRPSLALEIPEAPDTPPAIPITPEMGFNLIYSSGTTGTPKGIYHDRAFRARGNQGLIELLGFDETMRTLVSTPFYSNTTLFHFLAAMAAGGTAIVMEKFDPERFLQLSEAERITDAVLVPVQYERLLRHPSFGDYDLGAYRMKASTSAPLRAAVKRDILDRWPGGLVEFYGMTEGGVGCILVAHQHPDKLDTVGIPSPDADLKVMGEDGRFLPQGEIGELVGWSPNMMVGYHNRDEATREASWYAPDGRRYQRSGDIGWIDADGFVHLLDRKKDVIISGGFNIYATDLEICLLQHPAVADATVIGAPSVEWGETPVAFVVLRPEVAGDVAAYVADIRQWANERLGKAQRIAEVRLADALPRSSIGKVLKRQLRDQLQSEASPARGGDG
jgi:acyl-CoA synthetase (AMP-forming)/AMP-acid ligase II